MRTFIPLIAISIFFFSSLYADSKEEICKQQKEQESCSKFIVDSKSACIWDTLNKQCNVDTENRADYREDRDPFPPIVKKN